MCMAHPISFVFCGSVIMKGNESRRLKIEILSNAGRKLKKRSDSPLVGSICPVLVGCVGFAAC